MSKRPIAADVCPFHRHRLLHTHTPFCPHTPYAHTPCSHTPTPSLPPQEAAAKVRRFTGKSRTLTTQTEILVQFEHHLADSVEIKRVITSFPKTGAFESKHLPVPEVGNRQGGVWRVSRSEGEEQLTVVKSAIDKRKCKMSMEKLRKELGAEVIELVLKPQSVGEAAFVVEYKHPERAEGMPIYADSSAISVSREALGKVWYFTSPDDVEEVPATVVSELPTPAAQELVLALHESVVEPTEAVLREVLGEEAVALLTNELDCGRLLSVDGESLSLTAEGQRALAAAQLARMPEEYVAVMIARHGNYGGTILGEELQKQMTATTGAADGMGLLQGTKIGSPALLVASGRPKTWQIKQAGIDLTLPAVDLDLLLEKPPKEPKKVTKPAAAVAKAKPVAAAKAAKPAAAIKPVTAKPDAKVSSSSDVQQTPSERLQALMERLKELRAKTAVDPDKVRKRFIELMQEEEFDGTVVVEVSGQLWARAEEEVAANGVTAAQVDDIDVQVDVLLTDALRAAEAKVDELGAQASE